MGDQFVNSNPHQSEYPLVNGGQLSYLLSFCLTWFEQPSGLKQTLRLSLVSLPPLLHSVYQFHLLSLVINYLMIPFFSLIIMPLAIGGESCTHCFQAWERWSTPA